MSPATAVAAEAPGVDAPSRAAAPRFRWHPVPVAAPAGALAVRPAAGVLVIGGAAESRERVRAGLAGLGLRAVAIDLGGADSGELELLGQAAAAVAAHAPDGVVDLGMEAAFTLAAPGPWQAALRRTVAVLKAVYEDWAAQTDAARLFYLAVTRLGGQMGYAGAAVPQPLGGIWAGLAKTLPQELPNCRIKVVDLPAGVDAAPHVAAELRGWDLFEIGRGAAGRCTLAAQASDLPPPRLDLGPADTVLLSGGGRGLGFALARELGATFGCRVLVCGRHPLPSGDEEWAGLADDEFDQRERQRYGSLPAGVTIRAARAETSRRQAQREAGRNIDRARRDGLRIEYHNGDITDRAFARRLVAAAGPGLRVVVHNAGVASPTRLRNKSLESFVATVRTKVDGFISLVEALGELGGHQVDYFCNVGSVSGRIGGMIGQIDYAAANEALTRLGFWAQSRGLPVATICFPTWQQLGLVANFDAALRYAEALAVDDGVAHWIQEIRAAAAGEVMLLGRIGQAVSPSQLKGFAKFRDHPDTPRLQSLKHYLGEVEVYAPFASMRSRNVLLAGTQPAWAEFEVAGAAAMPVSLALEYALSIGDWVVPPGFPRLWAHELRDVVVRLPRLVLGAAGLELVKAGAGRQGADGWEVELALATGDEPALTALARYRDTPPPELPAMPVLPAAGAGQAGPGGQDGVGRAGSAGAGLGWAGVLYRPVSWAPGVGGRLVGRAGPVPASDEWTVPTPPASRLPHGALENILRVTAARWPLDRPVREVRIAALTFGALGDPTLPLDLVGVPDQGDWQAGAGHRTTLAIAGLALG
jgi:NAD(P)-dependent dehydrogenase (short-subunit alcohol dehydrogenase family)